MRAAPLSLVVFVAGCAAMPDRTGPQATFFEALKPYCGQAFSGRLVSSDPVDRDFAGQPIVMHVRQCSPDEILIPLHVGDDRSRTWILRRVGHGLELKHDHRHQDGSEDRLSRYGGQTADAGTEQRQSFPADAFSRDLFLREGNPASVDNVWAVEIVPGQSFAYELRRPNRHFRLMFDLARPVDQPPAPWGSN